MPEYIEREAAIKAIESVPDGNWRSIRYAKEVKAIPAADVALVRHGHWESDEYRKYYRWYCSCCLAYRDEQTPFCPSCGAKMD